MLAPELGDVIRSGFSYFIVLGRRCDGVLAILTGDDLICFVIGPFEVIHRPSLATRRRLRDEITGIVDRLSSE